MVNKTVLFDKMVYGQVGVIL